MKNFFHALLRFLIVGATLVGPAAAQTNLAGKWQGFLEVAPGKAITIHFVFTAAPGGGYSAVVNSPDEGAIKNVSAKSVTFADSRLTLDVPSLSGGYVGTLRNGVFEGEWSQEGAKLPLSLKPYGTQMTSADIDLLRGEWFGKLNTPGGELTMILRFSTGADGTLQAVFSVPEQGVKDWETRDATLDDGHFSVELPKPRARIAGTLEGDQIVGQFGQGGTTLPLTLKKGRYVAPVHYLDLPAEAREQLKGRWSGTLNNLPVIISFETDANGRTQGFFNSTKQRAITSLTEAKLAGTTLTFRVSYGATYKAELAGDKLTGEWTQAGIPKPLPLVLTRGKDGAPIDQGMTAKEAAPYLGAYWGEPFAKPQFVVFHEGRLELELPWRALRVLEKTPEEHTWAYVVKPENLVKFHRDGAGPATAMELRQSRITIVPRFEPEKGLPSLDELFALRPDPQRTKKLDALGTIRMSGSIERTTSKEKGSFEALSAGDEHSRVKLNLDGLEAQIVVAGNRAWRRPQASSPFQEMPEVMAKQIRLSSWQLATGDWRDEFKQARVLKRVELDGKPVFLVHAAPEKGRQRLVYLDVENGLTLGYDQVVELPEVGMIGCEVRYADYRDNEGVRIPFKSTVKYSEQKLGTWTYQVEKIETRLKLDSDPFTVK